MQFCLCSLLPMEIKGSFEAFTSTFTTKVLPCKVIIVCPPCQLGQSGMFPDKLWYTQHFVASLQFAKQDSLLRCKSSFVFSCCFGAFQPARFMQVFRYCPKRIFFIYSLLITFIYSPTALLKTALNPLHYCKRHWTITNLKKEQLTRVSFKLN